MTCQSLFACLKENYLKDCVRSEKCPHVMSLESGSVEDHKFEKIWRCGVRKRRVYQTSLAHCSTLLKVQAALATSIIDHLHMTGILLLAVTILAFWSQK